MARNSSNLSRLQINYFEGVNRLVDSNLSKKTEFSHAENARSINIGTIEKRRGTSMLGNSITATVNYKILYFENGTTPGFYRISTVGGVTSIYYLNSGANWVASKGEGTNLSVTAGNLFSNTIAENCCFLVNGDDDNRYINSNQYYFTVTSANATINDTYTNNGYTFTVLGTIVSGTILICYSVGAPDSTGVLTKTSGSGDATINFSANNLNIVTSSSATGHLYNTPPSRKINYYKGKIHLADYTVGSTRYPNSVMISSEPLGIVALTNLDYDAGVTTIEVTDTKYIYSTDSLDVYRGNSLIGTLTVSAKTESTITVTATGFAIQASDELWVANTYNGTRIFRWAGNPASGTTVKQYDTFTLSGGQNGRIKMFTNINDYEVISNNNNMTYWNGSTLKNLDIGIGCVSDNGYVKSAGALWFMHYTGIYVTTGYEIPKLISAPVQQYFDGATKAGLESGAIGKKGTSIFCSIGDVTLYNQDGSVDKTLSDVVLERNLRQETWYVHTGITATEFCTYDRSDTVDRLEFSSTDPGYHIMEFLNGETDDSTILQKEILFRVDTNDLALSSKLEKISYPQQLIVETERGSGLEVFVSLDGEPFYQLKGVINKGCSIIKINGKNDDDASPPRCRKIKISIRDFSKSICKISGIVIIYSETMEEEEQRD